jgi:hypothetical protein
LVPTLLGIDLFDGRRQVAKDDAVAFDAEILP